MKTELSRNQADILDHTINRAAGGRYCGTCPDMEKLVTAGLMNPIGTAAWGGDPYFTITAEGRAALRSWRELQPKAQESKKLTRSQIRYRDYLRSECGETFREWLKLKRYGNPA